ncbi:bifunctional folylpolyglutamate synthase/dihydrofolate synthase [Petrachloros mirabilis]
MTYASAVSHLYNLQKHGIKLGLETMTALVGRLGMPQDRYRSLHIAGTNGKGSTAAMAASILQAAGYRVGLYTSPHLVEFRERIRVDGEMISETEVARLTELLKGLCEPDLSPTFFEYATAMAFQHFAEQRIDVAVLEVGLGGRFDATNVVTPAACAVTTIALDHQEYLGKTVSSVAFEKAGIIKSNVPVIIGRVSGEALKTIEQVASERTAPLARLNREFHVSGVSAERFCYVGPRIRIDDLSCSLQGGHQIDNAACSVALIEAACSEGVVVCEEAVREGLAKVRWEGRLEVVERQPTVVLDGAHNPAAAEALASYLREFRLSHPGSRVVLVMGMMKDKDHRRFAEPLKDVVDDVVFTQADLPRSATAHELQAELKELWPHAHASSVVNDGVEKARRLARETDLICVAGSLMLVGDVKAMLHGSRLSPLRG